MKQHRKRKPKKAPTTEQLIRRRNFLSFGAFLALGTTAYGGFRWLQHAPKEEPGITGGAKQPFRKALNKTELAFRRVFSRNHLVKTYDKNDAAKIVRQNGNEGLRSSFVPAAWSLCVQRISGSPLNVTLDEIRSLPRTEIIFDFKCVEGWDQVQHWGGVAMQDFITHFHLEQEARLDYMGLATPDGQYYVGLDMDSALHPQTLLAYEMNGAPLPLPHGAPLRLIVPVKYGIKNLKRIGLITFSKQRPRDYWAERGYDYYSGL